MLTVLLVIAAVWVAFSVLAVVAAVGKPRTPVTGRTAAVAVVIWGSVLATLIWAAVEVS